jgi:hypothetical protein
VPDTFIKIASVTVGSGGASSIDFTSIPSTYTDLCLKISLRGTYAGLGDNIRLNINSKGANTGVTNRTLLGTGSSALSGTGDQMVFTGDTATASTFGNGEIYFPNYTSSANKSISADTVSENNGTTGYNFLNAMLWSYTEAITSIVLTSAAAANFKQYSTATLYGIKNS